MIKEKVTKTKLQLSDADKELIDNIVNLWNEYLDDEIIFDEFSNFLKFKYDMSSNDADLLEKLVTLN